MYLGRREYSNQIKMQKYLHILSNTLLYARYILIMPDILFNVFYEIHETISVYARYPLQCIGYTHCTYDIQVFVLCIYPWQCIDYWLTAIM